MRLGNPISGPEALLRNIGYNKFIVSLLTSYFAGRLGAGESVVEGSRDFLEQDCKDCSVCASWSTVIQPVWDEQQFAKIAFD